MAPARRYRTGAPSYLLHLVIDEPLLGQLVERAIGLQRLDRGIDRRLKLRALREDEAEILAAKRLADDLEGLGILSDDRLAGGGIGQDQIDIAGLQRLQPRAEGIEQLHPRVRFIAVQHVIDGGVEGRRARLGPRPAAPC